MGNICRSPTAHGVFRSLLEREGMTGLVEVDSAGTHAYHVGEMPDIRAQRAAAHRGIDLRDLRARQARYEDFLLFDYLLAMDRENLQILASSCPPGHANKLGLLMDFAPDLGVREVPDPYYGGPAGFDRVLDLVEAAATGLLEEIRGRLR
jgi:protein-tyrosine phosphatase